VSVPGAPAGTVVLPLLMSALSNKSGTAIAATEGIS
jgi:hypothetical protein